ncbi:hypothetical protein OIE66_40055 [Nonomuraea sp. NBC_01738]|uniref:hypothetical protein n=1 Tax=Nonomuraea sp. NBC_01738 TaxID=2976003 RepID=UPI002E15BE74|nr:hypothetical protein OIE66_40055 [Nonomuraea sp. NBC_01738]
MVILRLLAIGLLGGALAVPLFPAVRGDGFEHVRLAALMSLDMGQMVTVPVALVVGIVLAVTRSWNRTPGYVLGAITMVFGVIVVTQGWPTMSWVDQRPSGIGDPDGEFVIAFLAFASGAITILVGFLIVILRWSGYEPQAARARLTAP